VLTDDVLALECDAPASLRVFAVCAKPGCWSNQWPTLIGWWPPLWLPETPGKPESGVVDVPEVGWWPPLWWPESPGKPATGVVPEVGWSPLLWWPVLPGKPATGVVEPDVPEPGVVEPAEVNGGSFTVMVWAPLVTGVPVASCAVTVSVAVGSPLPV
jgi:hypothetical protein